MTQKRNFDSLNSDDQDKLRGVLEALGIDVSTPEKLQDFVENIGSDENRAKLLYATLPPFVHRETGKIVGDAELPELRTTLSSETDRGCALMAAAYLDVQLEILL